MLPTIHLLDTCRQWPSPENDTESVQKSLEALLTIHVILPFRAINIGSDQRVGLTDGDLDSSLSDQMTIALKQYRFPRPKQESLTSKATYIAERSGDKTQEHLIVTFLTVLFDVALACRPRHLPQLRRTEDTWLGALFSQLSRSLKQLIPQVATLRSQKTHAKLVKWMLRKAGDHKLRLSLPTIETILEETSGLFSEEDSIDWRIISLCILNDANAFTVPASSVNLGQDPPHRTKNKFLSALLPEITRLYLRPSLIASQEDYDYVLNHVLIPLGTEFSNARDLMSFLSHWKEQLNSVQIKRTNQAPKSMGLTLWEDQKFLESIAPLVELTLTPGQINQFLSAAANGLEPSAADALNDNPASLASIVLLDCLFEGITRDITVSQLATTAQSVFSLLEVILSTSHPQCDQWRMWRIEGTIADRWFPIHKTQAYKKTACSAISRAIQTINNSMLTNPQAVDVDLSERLHAFRHICCFIAKEDSFWDDPHFLSRRNIHSGVRTIMDSMEPFCRRIKQDIFGTIKSPDYVPTWDELYGSKLLSIDTFYFGCVSYMISSPYILE